MQHKNCQENYKSQIKTRDRIICFVLSIMLTLCVVAPIHAEIPAVSLAYDVSVVEKDKVAYVKVDPGNRLHLRSGPSTDYTVLAKLEYGTVFQITGETKDSEGMVWYEISVAQGTSKIYGFIRSDYAGFVTPDDDPEFEKLMIGQGFPESYREYLRVLHHFYPSWAFEPLITDLNWNDVVKNESVFSRNLVYSTNKSSWKSLVDGAFDWENNVWVGLSGDSWNEASSEILLYYLDPRNFLNELQIFQMETLSFNEAVHTVEGVNLILKGTFMYEKEVPLGKPETGEPITYAELFMEVGRLTDASPYMLAARVRQEQGVNGDNKLISGKVAGYEGYYNYFNINASGSTASEILKNGLEEAKAEGWTSPYLALYGGSRKVVSGHISKGQDTLYLQKFDVDDTHYGLYWHQYMQNIQAATSESLSVQQTYKNLSMTNASIAFKIPVFNNMPSRAGDCPQTDGNPNYRLKNLTVDGHNISPTFNHGQFSYTLHVDESVSSVKVSATTFAKTTKVTGCGEIKLNVGINEINILCVSERGDSVTYKLIVDKDGEASANPTNSPAATGTTGTSTKPVATQSAETTAKATATPTAAATATASADTKPKPPAAKPTKVPPAKETATPTPTPTPTPKVTQKPTATPTATPKATATPTPKVECTVSYNTQKNTTVNKQIVSGIEEGMTVEKFLKGVKVKNCTASVLDKSGQTLKNKDTLKTGDVLSVKQSFGDKKEVYQYTIILYGDVNCDGKINALDYVYIKRHVWNISSLTGVQLVAADVGKRDGAVNALDFVYIKRHVWGISSLTQE